MSTGKLATIVAVDVSGFSARAQANERAAVAAVARLIKRCAKVAKAHHGRIFNTAGDAVLMEFPSVSGGLAAADELAKNPDPPIRVGVHLGEVTQMANGDLLGHGVNVATRLQALAEPGGVIVSEDARRALRGPLSERLISKRSVKLDKIPEDIAIYDLSRDAEAVARAQAAAKAVQAARRTAFVSMAALGAALLVALAWPLLQPPSAPRVAVFSLAAPEGDATLQQLAQGVAEDVAQSLSASGVQPVARAETVSGPRDRRVARARALNAAFALDGDVERVGRDIRVTVAVVRASDRTMLWSNAYVMDAGNLAGLRLRAAERSADVLSCGVKALHRRRDALDTQALALFLRSCDSLRDSPLETHDMLLQVVTQEPHFPFARARLALSAAVASEDAPDTLRQTLRQSARSEAQRAIREDRRIGESYLALELLETPTNWGARESLLREALARDELNPTVNNFYSSLLQDVGRVSEALAYARRGVTLDPLSPSKRRNLAYLLLMNGRYDEASDVVEGMTGAWPEDHTLWRARMQAALWSGRYDDALALLGSPASDARSGEARTCWGAAVQALRDTALSIDETRRLLECDRLDRLPRDVSIRVLVARGDLDDAFALLGADGPNSSPVLFAPETAALRADPRFMPLTRDRGLLRYWRLSDHWPDFCRDPNLPYRCAAEAMRLT